MGTNFYHVEQPPCECCKREYPSRHIGKSSMGWAFALHVYPDDGINSLDDWEQRLKSGAIFDEYGARISRDEMIERVVNRPGTRRRPIDGDHCIGHGPGTWDLIIGDFS